MTTSEFTYSQQVQEPREPYSATPLYTKQAKVMVSRYPSLKSNPGVGAWRNIPWINLRGFWLEQVGFTIGTTYTIAIYDKRLVFAAD